MKCSFFAQLKTVLKHLFRYRIICLHFSLPESKWNKNWFNINVKIVLFFILVAFSSNGNGCVNGVVISLQRENFFNCSFGLLDLANEIKFTCKNPTDTFPLDASEINKISLYPHFKALKFWKGSVGLSSKVWASQLFCISWPERGLNLIDISS